VNFLNQSEEDRFLRYDRDGVSIRVDLKKLSDETRQATPKQLSEFMERLQR
jgi:ribosome recycling factor